MGVKGSQPVYTREGEQLLEGQPIICSQRLEVQVARSRTPMEKRVDGKRQTRERLKPIERSIGKVSLLW